MPDNGGDIVVVGASPGGVGGLAPPPRSTPADFGVPILVVLHIPPAGPSVLPQILDRSGPLDAVHAEGGMGVDGGGFYVAPPDRHMRVEGRRIQLDPGPRENGHRPAIDPLFRSAADSFGDRAAGVVLSGTLDDGTVGLYCIKQAGGGGPRPPPHDE